jgi:hypothetical protein
MTLMPKPSERAWDKAVTSSVPDVNPLQADEKCVA